MAQPTFPLAAYVGLFTDATAAEVTGKAYVRRAAQFVLCADGKTIANTLTLQWPIATDQWGTITAAQIWDSPSGGALLTQLPTEIALPVDRYDIARIPSGGIAFLQLPAPRGFGTGGFGTGGFGVAPIPLLVSIGSGLGTPYGVGSYGVGPYAAGYRGVLLEITFARPSHVCMPGTWAPDPAFQLAA